MITSLNNQHGLSCSRQICKRMFFHVLRVHAWQAGLQTVALLLLVCGIRTDQPSDFALTATRGQIIFRRRITGPWQQLRTTRVIMPHACSSSLPYSSVLTSCLICSYFTIISLPLFPVPRTAVLASHVAEIHYTCSHYQYLKSIGLLPCVIIINTYVFLMGTRDSVVPGNSTLYAGGCLF